MNDNQKACINCRHYKKVSHIAGSYRICRNKNYVGWSNVYGPFFRDPYDLRFSESDCGSKGVGFERKLKFGERFRNFMDGIYDFVEGKVFFR